MILTEDINKTEFKRDDNIQILIECGNSSDSMNAFVDKTHLIKNLLLAYSETFTLEQLRAICKSICPKKLVYLNCCIDNKKYIFCCSDGVWNKWELKESEKQDGK